MKLTEYRTIICENFCKNHLGQDNSKCQGCAMEPTREINFELSNKAKALIEMGVFTDGSVLLKQWSDTGHERMRGLFGLEEKK